jgi:hypothetical protein
MLRRSKAQFSKVVNNKIRGLPPLPHIRIGRRLYFIRESVLLWLRQVESLCSVDLSESSRTGTK